MDQSMDHQEPSTSQHHQNHANVAQSQDDAPHKKVHVSKIN